MAQATIISFSAQNHVMDKLAEMTKQTGLSRSRLLVRLVEAARVEPVTTYEVAEIVIKDNRPAEDRQALTGAIVTTN